MKLIYISDIHVDERFLHDRLTQAMFSCANAVIIGGDIVPKGLYTDLFRTDLQRMLSAQKDYIQRIFIPAIIQFREDMPDVQVYLDLCNDDFWAIRPLLQKASDDGHHKLHHMQKHPLTEELDISLDESETIETDLSKLDLLVDKPFIFVSHAPPFDSGLDYL